MFTGIVEEVGRVLMAGSRLRVGADAVLQDLTEGGSVAVNGVCLTAFEMGPGYFDADLAPETLRRSNLADLRIGAAVNLERPVTLQQRLSGHLVQGHVDATAELRSFNELENGNWWLAIHLPPELARYVVEKGSIAIDGISLTVAELKGSELAVAIVPHTYRNTALRERTPGQRLNIECDVLAKYVERLLATGNRAYPTKE